MAVDDLLASAPMDSHSGWIFDICNPMDSHMGKIFEEKKHCSHGVIDYNLQILQSPGAEELAKGTGPGLIWTWKGF